MDQTTYEANATAVARLRAVGFDEHLKFFDADGDHKISLRECQRGLERLGFGHLVAVPAALGINAGVAALGLLQRRLLNPLGLDVAGTGAVRHPDTALVDDEGVFDDARLDAVFARYGREHGGAALTLPEVIAMVSGRLRDGGTQDVKQLLLLPAGALATGAEWGALFWVAHTTRGARFVLEKESVRRFYTDAGFFEQVAQRLAQARAARSGSALGRARNIVQTWFV